MRRVALEGDCYGRRRAVMKRAYNRSPVIPFPDSFLFGTATAATQIEGGTTTSDWYAFARRPGRIKHGDTPDVACDGWRRWPEDVALQRSLGMGAYRMSIEWARIEPRPAEIDHGAIETYRRMLGALRDAGIEPMVTLYHFTLPLWLAERGGLLAPDFPECLARFARVAAATLGDLCRLWVTINEPNVLVAHAYLLGVWPPGQKNPVAAVRAHQRLLAAHVAAYRALKAVRGDDAQVGVAHHMRVTQPLRPAWRTDRLAARLFARVFNDAFAIALCEGTTFPEARGTHDFFGLNYYSRDVVRFSLRRPAELFVARGVPDGAPVSDLGWEIYPEGLGQLLTRWGRRSGRPMYVTENGIADAADAKRPAFLTRHLQEVARAASAGVDVRGYFHWSLLDNFEWAEGYWPRFGLVEVDYATQERRVRPSGRLYAQIARDRRIEDRGASEKAPAPQSRAPGGESVAGGGPS
jgi:beta-glucosidase